MDSAEALARLLAATRGDATRELSDARTLVARLIEIDREVHARWPGIQVASEAFFEHLGRHLPSQGALAALSQMHVADLYLAFACANHDRAALKELEQNVIPPLTPAIARIADETIPLEDVMQNVMTKLLTSERTGEDPKILQYSGKGPLGAWLRVAAVRAALSLRRKRVDEPHTDEQLLAHVPQSGADPEILHLRAHYAAEFETAFQDTVRHLTPRDRNLLHLHFVEGLTTDQIGLTYGVHGATAARWIGRTRQALFDGTKTLLADRLRLSPSEFQSLMALLLSQLDVSIRHLLASSGMPDAGES